MGVMINHAISFLTSPLAVSLALIVLGCVAGVRRRRLGAGLTLLGVLWLWFMSTSLAFGWLGQSLERPYSPVRVETLPEAEAIVVLGGGVGANTNTLAYAELYMGADRVAHAARLWKAGKAPVVIASGTNELNATRPLLLEWGVPESAILIENESRNTEENAKLAAAFARERNKGADRPKVLLVTSAWHMRRSLLMFRKYAPDIEVVPAACDYEATIWSDAPFTFRAFLPDADALMRNSYMLKEHIGYWGYKLLR